jgi:hypothetical protein
VDSIAAQADNLRNQYSSSACGWDKVKDSSGRSKGWSTGYSFDTISRTLLTLYKEDSYLFRDVRTYYIYKGRLILVVVDRFQKNDSGDKIFGGKYYYHNDNLVDKKEIGKPFENNDNHLDSARMIIKTFRKDQMFHFACAQHRLAKSLTTL